MIPLSRPWNESIVDDVMDEGSKRRRNARTCFVYGDNTMTFKFISDSLLSSSPGVFLGVLKELQRLTDNVDLAFIALRPIAQILF